MFNMLKEFKNLELSKDNIKEYGYVDGISLQNLFYANTHTFPSCFTFSGVENPKNWFVDTQSLLKFLSNKHKDKHFEVTYNMEIVFNGKDGNKMDDNETNNSLAFNFILPDFNIYMRIERQIGSCYVLYDNAHVDMAREVIDDVIANHCQKEKKENIFWRVCNNNGYFYLDDCNIKFPDNFSVEKEYNDDFTKEHEKICRFIGTDDDSGLILLHGQKGTGKSSYIKYLINKYPNKQFVYVPANLVPLLSDPSFGSFLTTLNNNIIVVEDCENVIQDRQSSSSASAVSLLLNMTDGLLSDDLGIKFICTFNEDIHNIDKALLRKGRLVSKYEFKPLCVEKTNALLEELGYTEKSTKALPLSDIFNYSDDSYEIVKKSII